MAQMDQGIATCAGSWWAVVVVVVVEAELHSELVAMDAWFPAAVVVVAVGELDFLYFVHLLHQLISKM